MNSRKAFFCFLSLTLQASVMMIWGDLESSNWGSFGQRETQGETFEVPFKIDLKGKYSEGQIVLEGTTRIKNQRLSRYFKSQETESEPVQSSIYQNGDSSASDSFNSGTFISILNGGFKLLKLNPIAGTSKVTAEVYMGEDKTTPVLEAVEVRLNPFKKTPFEVVFSSLTEVDLRKVKAVVTLKTGVAEEYRESDFTGELNGYIIVGDSYSQPGFDDGSLSQPEQGETTGVGF
jgi:hypothetical protein